jgi:flagellar biogenesis protein FliO
VALLLVLGPLSMRAGAARAEERTEPPVQPAPVAAPTAAERPAPPLPRTPDLWQVGSTLLGVLLLGGTGLIVLRRLRRGPAAGGGGAIALRQSLRLSPRLALHAVEFDGRLLLVGEGERGLQLLHAAEPGALAELEPAAAPPPAAADGDGAVPRDLVLPRPPAAAPASRRPAEGGRTAAARDTARAALLGDFRSLLAKAGR